MAVYRLTLLYKSNKSYGNFKSVSLLFRHCLACGPVTSYADSFSITPLFAVILALIPPEPQVNIFGFPETSVVDPKPSENTVMTSCRKVIWT